MNRLSVLGLNNNFYGSYSSNQVFFEELMQAFRQSGVCIFTASSTEQAEEILKQQKINFSISFSKYYYENDGIPLYEKYKIPNYQWVSDNPLKMNLDVHSQWITYIFIDEEYPDIVSEPFMNTPLFLPLGFLSENVLTPAFKKEAVLLPCKIRNLKSIEEKIQNSAYAKEIKNFLEEYQYDSSYIKMLKNYFQRNHTVDVSAQSIIFRLSNEYVRVRKRLYVAEHIQGYDVWLLGTDYGNQFSGRKIYFML